jgi:hypothetical protein
MIFITSVAARALQSWQASPKEGPVCLVRLIDEALIYLRCVALGARPSPKAINLSISDRVSLMSKYCNFSISSGNDQKMLDKEGGMYYEHDA